MNWDSRFSRYLVWLSIVVLTISLIGSGGILLGLVPDRPVIQAMNFVPTSATATRGISAAILIMIAFVYIRTDPSDAGVGTLVSQESPPETPRHAPQLTSTEFDSVVTDSLREIQLKDIAYEDTTPRQNLRETAQMAITVAFSCNEVKAEEILKSGEWTDDTVAEAFLASDIAYPVGFRLFRWANPGQAYIVALDRTSQSIIELTNNAQNEEDAGNRERDSDISGLLSTLRADIKQKRVETASFRNKKHREDPLPTEYRQDHHSGQTQSEHSEIDE